MVQKQASWDARGTLEGGTPALTVQSNTNDSPSLSVTAVRSNMRMDGL